MSDPNPRTTPAQFRHLLRSFAVDPGPLTGQVLTAEHFARVIAEEAGLLGSREYVAGLPPEELARITGYLNFDMVGSPNHVFFIIAKNQLNPKNQTVSIEPYTNIAIEELQLSVRAYNCLKKAQINTVGDLLQYSPEKLQELKNFGRKSSDEVFSTLKNKLGIILK